MGYPLSRRRWVGGTAAASALAALHPSSALAALERPKLNIGIPNALITLLPIYVAASHFWNAEGLDAELLLFHGDTEVTQALAANMIDVAVASPVGLFSMIAAGRPVIGFYQGFYQTGFTWVAQRSIKSWADLKGKQLGISTAHSVSAVLTRYVLQKHHLVANKDVRLVNVGGGPNAYPALLSGTLDAAFEVPPFTWECRERGFTTLGTQDREVGKLWPLHMFFAKRAFLDDNPATVTALLRAHVAAIRYARANREAAVAILRERLKLGKEWAERSYDEVIGKYDERGRFPESAMPVFWKIMEWTGIVKRPWPMGTFFDTRYVASFERWAPKG